MRNNFAHEREGMKEQIAELNQQVFDLSTLETENKLVW